MLRLFWAFLALTQAQKVFEVPEGAPIGTLIGSIGTPGPYLIVPIDQANPEEDLIVNQNNGEIRTKQVLDREKQEEYVFSAIPLNGESIQVRVKIQDINDHTPDFGQEEFTIDIPENIPSGTKRKLPPAQDPDEDGVKSYQIVQGNVGEAFDLEFDGQEALDLVVKGNLDRERLDKYSMVILAEDGGTPSRSSSMTLTVQVQDLNDSPPVFSKQRYFTSVSENLPIGSSVLQVYANDADQGANAQVTYSINRRQSDKDSMFNIDPANGLLTVNKKLSYERQSVHEIVVVARDGGEVPQETSAFITVRLTNDLTIPGAPSAVAKPNDQLAKLKLKYLQGGDTVSEFVPTFQPFAQVLPNNGLNIGPGDKYSILDSNLFSIDQKNGQIAALQPLDYEQKSSYVITVRIDKTNGQTIEERLTIDVTDGNEHEPEFDQQTYQISLSENMEIGASVLTIQAQDLDQGQAGQISYSLRYSDTSSSSFSDWFSIDEESGLITTQSKLDCELESNPQVIIVASDHGIPIKTSTATFSASISDVNDHKPLFSQTFYDMEISEDSSRNTCFLTLKATDDDCGENAIVHYSLKEHTDFFKVDPDSGEICIVKQLDYEKQKTHSLIVEAKDKGGLSTSTLVNIAVTDVNDNIPEFLPSVYMAKITRSTALNVPILTVKALDRDYDLKGKLKYSITRGNEDGIFTLGSESGSLYLAKKLIENRTYRLKISATDGEGQKSANEANVVVQMTENVPFAKYQFEFQVAEDISPYSEIGRLIPNAGSLFKYELLEQSVAGYFSLDSRSGVIRTEARLDHETHPQVILNVQAENNNGQVYFVQAIISISDVNDNAPEFPFGSMSTTVPEDFPISGVFYTTLATDADVGNNGKVKYKMAEYNDKFSIDETTGEIRLTQPLDYEDQDHHRIVVQAEDSGTPVLRSNLKLDIYVQDVNDNAPIFDKEEYMVALSAESYLQDTPLVTIHAEDKDNGKNGRVTYSITSNPFLNILPNSGVLILKAPLQKETNPTLELIVVATDNGLPARKSSARVKIVVSDKNDYAPKFPRSKYVFDTLENLPSGTKIGVVQAEDKDEGLNGEVEYRFRAPNSRFQIQADSGEIRTREMLDREDIENFELLVEALDKGSPPKSAQTLVKIQVTDVNDESPQLEVPLNKMLYVAKSGYRSSSIIGAIVASDKDLNDVLTYEVTGSNGVVIDKWTGELKLTSRDLMSQAANLTVTVKITDSAQNSITEDIAIFFVDESANELSIIDYVLPVDKQAQIGSLVGDLSNLVSSRRDKFLFKFQQQNHPFYINAASGQVFVVQDLDNVDSIEVDAVIESTTGQTAPLQARVSFEIQDLVNQDRPSFDEDPITVDISEDAHIGDILHQIKPEKSQDVTYAMLDQLPNEAFSIESRSGMIKLAKQLDYERDQSYVLTVRVTESRSQLSTFVTVIVNVQDTNDNQPEILSTDVLELSSDALVGKAVFQIIAIDQDAGDNGKLKYSILSGNDDNVFEINEDNGALTLSKSALKDHYLRIRVTDQGSPALFTDQELYVKTSNDNYGQPKFLQSPIDVAVQENSPLGTTISALKTLNSEGLNLNYQLLVGQDKFSLDQASGQLKTQVELDREKQDKYSLVVSVSDQRYPQLSDTAIVNVNILDVNDNDPAFGASCRDLNIPENSAKGYIHTLIAYDQDSGRNGQVMYNLRNSEVFSIDKSNGQLSSPALDREAQSSYKLEVIVEDQGSAQVRSASCMITVNVMDENDNEPSFSQSLYSASVKEDVPLGTEVLKVYATDPDEGANAAIKYSIENATHSAFTINANTGSIITTESLDRETLDQYTFDVMAVDGGKGMVKSSRAVVTILITDANDHTPQFDQFPFRVNMSATPTIGTPLLRLSATDPDLGAHSQLTYNLIRPEQRAKFELSANEGILTVNNEADINWEPGTVERLEVAVSDAGRPPRLSTGLVEVYIEGGPAVTLSFQQDTYHAEVLENPSSGEDLAKVHAVRSDGRRQRVIYTFLRGNENGAFEINSNNGLIRVRDPEMIDYESHKTFSLTVQGQGLGLEDLNAYTTVIIKVKDVNDNVPKFTQEVYQARVQEGYRKNSVVTTVAAFDLDYEQNNDITYDIIGGNVDEAFYMTTAQPGVILANAVLDREVRGSYELVVAANDNGSPSLTGRCKVFIDILDSNDTPLQFPNFPPFKISRSALPGTLIATIRANDIDLQSQVSYTLKGSEELVAISTFTGQMFLKKAAKDWDANEVEITVEAFDGAYKTSQDIKIVVDNNSKDCVPTFDKALFRFQLSLNATFPVQVGDVQATSCGQDSTNLVYSLLASGFASIISSNGTIVITQPMPTNTSKLIVQAQDRRSKKIASAVVVIDTKATVDDPLEFDISGDTFEIGMTREVLQLKLKNDPSEPVVFNVSSNPLVTIDTSTGILYKKSHIQASNGNIKVSARKLNSDEHIEKSLRFFLPSALKARNQLVMKQKSVSLPTNSDLNTRVDLCDYKSSTSSQILSGNDDNLFSLDSAKQVLVLVKNPTQPMTSSIVLRNGDLNICAINIEFKAPINQKDTLEVFPIKDLVTTIPENTPRGTPIITIPTLRIQDVTFSTDSYNFEIDPQSGVLRTGQPLDYEQNSVHQMQVFAEASNGQKFICNLKILIESQDEYSPRFTQDVYTFNVPKEVGPGFPLGTVQAEDEDAGPDGVVSYSLSPLNAYFDINHKSGSLTVRRPLDTGVLQPRPSRSRRSLAEIRLNIVAKSLNPNSKMSMTKVVLYVNEESLPIAQSTENVSATGVVVPLIIVLILLIGIGVGFYYCHKNYQMKKTAQKIALLPNPPNQSFTDQPLEMVGTRYPPQYSEIMSDYERATTVTSASNPAAKQVLNPRSEMSEKSHRSTSSGRGSVEDEEDADTEIRMINEGNWTSLNSSSNQHHYEGDQLSQGSVQNTEEYLARLGIDMRKPPNVKLAVSEDPYSSHPTGSIYNRIADDAMSEHNSTISAVKTQSLLYGSTGRQLSMTGSLSSIVHSEEELAGSYNWDYLLDWCPQYQNLAHVFKEISKLKDDNLETSTDPGTTPGSSGRVPFPLMKHPSIGNRLVPIRGQSPIAQDMLSQNALSPSFHPSLSPLATKSPSVSPMSVPLKRDLGPPRIGRGPLN